MKRETIKKNRIHAAEKKEYYTEREKYWASMSVMNVMMTTLMKSRMISMKNIILHPKRKRSLSARMIMILEHLMMITIPVNMLISAFWKKKRSLLSSISSKESGTSDTL